VEDTPISCGRFGDFFLDILLPSFYIRLILKQVLIKIKYFTKEEIMEMLKKRNTYLFIALILSFLTLIPAYGNTVITLQSTYTDTPPIIDGSFTSGEWPSTAALEIPFPIHTRVYISNDKTYLYMFIDAASVSGDYMKEDQDHCSVYVYNSGKGLRITVLGDETQYCESTDSASAPLSWTTISCPSGVQAVAGFGPGPDKPTPHRMYEFTIPLSFIGAASGGLIYFGSPEDGLGSIPFDYNGGSPRENIWPLGANPGDFSTWELIQLASPSVGVAVPTLNEWGIIILIGVVGTGSVYYLRKRRATA
jgi:hypothetical protein